MEDLYSLILERNARETLPFLSIHASNAHLRSNIETLQARCESLERQYLEQQQLVAEQAQAIQISEGSGNSKTETRLRDQVAKLQEELKEKIEREVKCTAQAVETSKELSTLREERAAQDAAISSLQMEATRKDEINAHLQSEAENASMLARLAEKQIDGLKDAIRALQEENEEISKLNKRLLDEAVSEKEKMAEQFNNMNDTIETLQKEASMLRSYAKTGKGPAGWFGRRGEKGLLAAANTGAGEDSNAEPKRQWGTTAAAVLPSQPLYTIKAHRDDASCVRYDATNLNRVATASSDATVKVFDTSNGQVEATFSAGGRQPLIGVDIGGDIVCGCGADKTCRVWNQRTKRMIHQLAGHSQKITCVRLFPGEKSVVTGSADRSIRIWDISRHIYHQTTTFRHSSTTNCSDASGETQSVVSGHLDGGLRCWDVRSGDRVLDIAQLHEGGVTSVQWKPGSSNEILTNGRDSALKIVDARTQAVVKSFRHPGFRTLSNHSSSSFSPDGAYVAAGSGDSGDVFVWKVASGELEKKLSGHQCGAVGLAWGRGGTNGQQVAAIDKSGVLVLHTYRQEVDFDVVEAVSSVTSATTYSIGDGPVQPVGDLGMTVLVSDPSEGGEGYHGLTVVTIEEDTGQVHGVSQIEGTKPMSISQPSPEDMVTLSETDDFDPPDWSCVVVQHINLTTLYDGFENGEMLDALLLMQETYGDPNGWHYQEKEIE
ncbi:hypothetical protein ACHAXT_003020 [Thalassiosira profunda]